MFNLSEYYRIRSRDGAINVCDEIAEVLTSFYSNPENEGKRIIIHVNGQPNGGKSLFWDKIKKRLLSRGGDIITEDSKSSDYHGRVYETWTGNLNGYNKRLKLFFCNISSLYEEEYDYREKAKNANIVILTNSELLPKHLREYDLSITINGAKTTEGTDGAWDKRLLLRSTTSSIFKLSPPGYAQ